jgi:hypothetical protein
MKATKISEPPLITRNLSALGMCQMMLFASALHSFSQLPIEGQICLADLPTPLNHRNRNYDADVDDNVVTKRRPSCLQIVAIARRPMAATLGSPIPPAH